MIVDAVKAKALGYVSVMFVTALLMCGYGLYSQHKEVKILTSELASLNTLKDLQNETIENLRKDLEEKPKQVITITKEVQSEVCKGVTEVDRIMNLPSKVKSNRELVHETDTQTDVVDIDDRLPADLIKLLN